MGGLFPWDLSPFEVWHPSASATFATAIRYRELDRACWPQATSCWPPVAESFCYRHTLEISKSFRALSVRRMKRDMTRLLSRGFRVMFVLCEEPQSPEFGDFACPSRFSLFFSTADLLLQHLLRLRYLLTLTLFCHERLAESMGHRCFSAPSMEHLDRKSQPQDRPVRGQYLLCLAFRSARVFRETRWSSSLSPTRRKDASIPPRVVSSQADFSASSQQPSAFLHLRT